MRMARGFGRHLAARTEVEWLLDDIARGDWRTGVERWTDLDLGRRWNTAWVPVAYAEGVVILGRGLARGEQIADAAHGSLSALRVVPEEDMHRRRGRRVLMTQEELEASWREDDRMRRALATEY